jgi:hypothetical protein
LVAQVLAAASYADEVAFADLWLAQNQNLQGTALTQAVDQQSWDPSVKALTQFPSVLHNLAKNLSWTSSLGQAFENQQSDVMAAVQFMRAEAQAAGTLQSSPQIKVVQQSPQTIVIEPANSNVVYVPQYNPAVVYGTPLVVPAYTPPVAVAAGVSFGAGVALGAAFRGGGFVAGGFGGGWGFGAWGMNWGGGGGGGNINYNNNTYITRNNINRNSNNNNNNGNRNNNNGNRNFNNGNRSNSTNEANNRNNGNRPDVPNGGRNGNHGLIGGNGGVQHQTGDSERAGRFGSEQPRSAMSGNGNQARAESNRGRASMRPQRINASDRANSGKVSCASSTFSNHASSAVGAAVSAVGAVVRPIVPGSLMYGLKPVPFVQSWFSRRLLGRTPTRILHPPQVS